MVNIQMNGTRHFPFHDVPRDACSSSFREVGCGVVRVRFVAEPRQSEGHL